MPGKIYDINIRKKPSGTVDLKAQYEIYNDDETISSLSKKEFNKIIGMCKSDT
ncbi:MAG: hypothetical protein KAJ54_00825 [Candidatus Aenigmarchaeota archaeon]|nr:hypothetical protein [Candidatus Aenigmarchaeota archaeon]